MYNMEDHLKKIDYILKLYLQRDISLAVNNKIVRTGKFILYNFHDFHLELDIIYNNKIKKTMVPIPFDIEHYREDSLLYFDYRVKTLFNKLVVRNKENKYYNNILEIQFK